MEISSSHAQVFSSYQTAATASANPHAQPQVQDANTAQGTKSKASQDTTEKQQQEKADTLKSKLSAAEKNLDQSELKELEQLKQRGLKLITSVQF